MLWLYSWFVVEIPILFCRPPTGIAEERSPTKVREQKTTKQAKHYTKPSEVIVMFNDLVSHGVTAIGNNLGILSPRISSCPEMEREESTKKEDSSSMIRFTWFDLLYPNRGRKSTQAAGPRSLLTQIITHHEYRLVQVDLFAFVWRENRKSGSTTLRHGNDPLEQGSR